MRNCGGGGGGGVPAPYRRREVRERDRVLGRGTRRGEMGRKRECLFGDDVNPLPTLSSILLPLFMLVYTLHTMKGGLIDGGICSVLSCILGHIR